MNDVGLHRDVCIERLEAFMMEMQGIIDLIGQKDQLVDQEAATAKTLLGELKNRLHHEIEIRSTESGRQEMSLLEGACYLPAIKEAYNKGVNKLSTKTAPGKDWAQILSGALLDMDLFLSQLKRL